jgi:PRC-barrel domain
MTPAAAGNNATPNLLVESHRVEGTPVYSELGKRIGNVRHLVIEKASGRVVYVVISFGGFLGIGSQPRPIPWEMLKYDTTLHGYRTKITEAEVENAPAADEKLWCDHRREKEVRDYWDVPPFRGV